MAKSYFDVPLDGTLIRFHHAETETVRDLELATREIYFERNYTSDNCMIRPGDVVLDGGAHIGLFTLYALHHGTKLVIAVDPNHRVLKYLEQNVKHNGFEGKVITVHAALWHSLLGTGNRLHFNIRTRHSMTSRLTEPSNTEYTHHIDAVTIDSIADEYQTPINFIKLDTEGCELQALEGAAQTIARCKPNMAICLYHHADYADKIAVNNFIDKFGLGYDVEYRGAEVKGICNLIGLWSAPK